MIAMNSKGGPTSGGCVDLHDPARPIDSKDTNMREATTLSATDEDKESEEHHGGKNLTLRVDGVRKSFGDNQVLRGVSFDIHRHEVVTLLGPSGSGKSTLMRCINLLEQVDDGQIWLNGTDISDPRINADRTRSRIGVVFQQFNLFPHMDVLKNVTLGAIKVHGISKDDAQERAMTLLRRIGMEDKAHTYPDQLSGGQQQRVAIARSLMTEPELLLLDEITSALDPMLVGEVLQMVQELKDQGTTILMATHEMQFAHDAADRVILLQDGEIAENGTPQEVMHDSQNPRTREFFSHFRGL
ncbi:amino acid ABC transporter ATP-binding protein [Bifidobacterium bombi]|uniref:Amino acid ABC transporter, ATP-binding protein n=1 Tax=Bifidobacterium bombi DSM 19703 TaxID=1341695 RepID=A0A080N349_9BIFI|nr:amino acid ABC transporter ATP-binding protein [Bifidobacterium bombi]KFF31341.1 amino acid ABC transporter, ATP-binding protein [Bifidobacterium bombi DSM 19703]